MDRTKIAGGVVTTSLEPSRFKEARDIGLWDDWRWQMRNRLTTIEQVSGLLSLTQEEEAGIRWADGRFKMAITPYFFSLIDPVDPDCPIRRQVIPRIDESVIVKEDLSDPCGEVSHTPVPGLVHRYPDRVLMIITETCAAYCRYCTRKRIVSSNEKAGESSIPLYADSEAFHKALGYIRSHKEIRDVLISGGDPLILDTPVLERVLSSLREIDHVEILRIGTKIPVTMPQRIDDELIDMLKRYHPLFMSIHFTHPKELTDTCKKALDKLADAGMPLGSQTVLLRGINDDPETMMELMHELLKLRVRPYYLYQADLVPGTAHFRTPIDKGLEIIERMRGYTSGYAIPTFVIDAPGGGGKVPISPDYIINREKGRITIRNYQGRVFHYIEPDDA